MIGWRKITGSDLRKTKIAHDLLQIPFGRRCYVVSPPDEAVAGSKSQTTQFNLEVIFCARYKRIARIIARVVRDPARAEELAVEVFLKLWRTPKAQGKNTDGWLYRVAVRKGLDELRRQTRRNWYESRFGFGRVPSPEDIHAASEKQERVRLVLAVIDPRQAELLLLRSHGLSYDELASAFELNVASIGTFLSRAQHSFRKEYITRYGARW